MATLQEFAAYRQTAGATGLKAFTVSKNPTEWKPISVTKNAPTVTPTKVPTEPQPTNAPIKITPGAKKVPLTLLQQAQQTLTGIGQGLGILPREKLAPIKITPGQKKLEVPQLEQVTGERADSATLTPQAKQVATQKFKEVQSKYKKAVDKTGLSIIGELADVVKQGTLQSVSDIGASTEMVGNMSKQMLLTSAGKKIQAEADKVLKENPQWASDPLEKWGTKKVLKLVAGAVPSLLAVIGASIVAGPVGGIATGFALEAGSTYKEAKAAGVSEQDAQKYGIIKGSVNSILERIFPSKLLKGKAVKEGVEEVSKSLVKEFIKKAGKYGIKFAENGAIEGSTEALQEAWGNIIATNYDKNRRVWDNVLESFVGGFGSGGVAGVTEQSIRKNLPQGENDPQTVINEVLKQKAENTEEGKALIKEAIIAQKTGEKVVIEKTQEQIAQEEADKSLLESEQAMEVETKDTEYTKQIREKISKLEEDISLSRQENEVKKSILDQFEGKTIQGMRTLKRSMMSIVEKGGDYQTDIKKLSSYNKTIYDVMAAIGTDSEAEAIRYIKEDLPDTIVKADTKQALQEIRVLKSHIKPTEASAPRQQLPVGEGKERVSRLEARMKGVMDSATEEQIQNLGLTTYQQMNKKETIAKAAEYVSTNRNEAIKVLKGDLEAPKGIPPEALYIALTQASKEDATLITKLASLQATAIGQRLSLLTELDTDSPVKLLNEVYKIREEQAKKKYKNLKKVVDTGVENARKEIKQVNKYDWNAFISSIDTC